MTVAIYVTSEADAKTLIPWGTRFAHADQTGLLVVAPQRSREKREWRDLEPASAEDNPLSRRIFETVEQLDHARWTGSDGSGTEPSDAGPPQVVVQPRQLVAPSPERSFADQIGDLDITLLLLPAHQFRQTPDGKHDWCRDLFRNAPCDTILLSGNPPAGEGPLQILIASDGDQDSKVALERSRQLLETYSGSATLMMVGPNNDIVAREIAEKKLHRLAQKLDDLPLEKRVELADNLVDGINQLELESFDLVFIGTRQAKKIARIIRDHDSRTDENARRNLAIIRGAVPLADRLWLRFQAAVRGAVPQLEREDRINLVEQLQTHSTFNFDFVALISLSTLIAALGLRLNSGSVVIGAMLVAPLMTPLVGTGFSLVQGNMKLIRNALRSLLLGFAMAYVIGLLVGITLTIAGWTGMVAQLTITPEMESRGHPSIIDLVVALASGIAGAYAMGRPNLVSAIPGVAIAAALVPPIATSGMAVAAAVCSLLSNSGPGVFQQDLALAVGSLLLFVTNIVAIILGTGIVFWAVGINDEKIKAGSGERPAPTWPRIGFLAFVILSVILAVVMPNLPLDEANSDLKNERPGAPVMPAEEFP